MTTKEELERMIDATSLGTVLTWVSAICVEKGAHIEETWQDKRTARPWFKAGERIGKEADTNTSAGI